MPTGDYPPYPGWPLHSGPPFAEYAAMTAIPTLFPGPSMTSRPTPLPMLRYTDAEGRPAFVAADQVVRITQEGEESALIHTADGAFFKAADTVESLLAQYHQILGVA